MELRVKVNRVCFPPPSPTDDAKEPVWYILDTDKGTCKGSVAWRPKELELLKLEGNYQPYQGRQEFKFRTAMQDIPIQPQHQLRYIAERTNGVGPSMEAQIWEIWGEDWMEDITPGVITRLSGRVYENVREAIDQFKIDKVKSESIAWLMGKGATLGLATLAWGFWDKQAITVVNTDCYELTNLPNYGFKDVDKSMRYEFGIGDEDPRRIRAAIVYAIKQMTEHGSTIVTWAELSYKCTEVLSGMYTALVCEQVSHMFGTGVLRAFPATESISLGRDYENENAIWRFVNDERSDDDHISLR
jgi:hypothetical protein